MLTKQDSKELVLFLEDYLSFYSDFLKAESQKYEAIVQNDIESLDCFVKQEQALLLKSRGMEAKRDKLNQELFGKIVTLRETIPLVDGEYKEQIEVLHERLADTLLDLKQMNSRSNSMAELRLHRIDVSLKNLENNPDLQKEYSSDAKTGKKINNSISKKV